VIEIYNAVGQLVLKENLSNNQFHVNIAAVEKGMYDVKVQHTDGSNSHENFVKE
jgi:hypothetical protein